MVEVGRVAAQQMRTLARQPQRRLRTGFSDPLAFLPTTRELVPTRTRSYRSVRQTLLFATILPVPMLLLVGTVLGPYLAVKQFAGKLNYACANRLFGLQGRRPLLRSRARCIKPENKRGLGACQRNFSEFTDFFCFVTQCSQGTYAPSTSRVPGSGQPPVTPDSFPAHPLPGPIADAHESCVIY